jgi:hypothetical protein
MPEFLPSETVNKALKALSAPFASNEMPVPCRDKKAELFRSQYFKTDHNETRFYCRFEGCKASYSDKTNRTKWEDHLLSTHKISAAEHQQVKAFLTNSSPTSLPMFQPPITNYTSSTIVTEQDLVADFSRKLVLYSAAHNVPIAAVTSDSTAFVRLIDAMSRLIRYRHENFGSQMASIDLPDSRAFKRD